MELTKEYLDKQLANQFKLTKDYLDGKLFNFATKDDLKLLATKEDLERHTGYMVSMINETIATPMTKTFEKIVNYLQPSQGFETMPWLVQDKKINAEESRRDILIRKRIEHKDLQKMVEEQKKQLKKFKAKKFKL